jgi:hypothetical protein
MPSTARTWNAGDKECVTMQKLMPRDYNANISPLHRKDGDARLHKSVVAERELPYA